MAQAQAFFATYPTHASAYFQSFMHSAQFVKLNPPDMDSIDCSNEGVPTNGHPPEDRFNVFFVIFDNL
jgi:hypothetical protein